ncbi:MAG: hypothetical protein NTW13_01795, partial [Candidatus Omnitrophica bacterium]|nr:hypothetical protein [Candidatus Omnitrophota bacterium]
PGQPTVNPRLVKEAVTLFENGYEVHVIYNFWVRWADEFDEELFQKYPKIHWYRVGGHPVFEPIRYLWTRIRRKAYLLLFKIFKRSFFLTEKYAIRAYPELLKKTYRIKADLYIAHNLGALPVAVMVAKKYNAKVGFDAEDYHRGETNSNSKFYIEKITQYLEDKYFTQVNYCTVASPQIGEAYQQLYPQLKPITIHNVFHKKLVTCSPTLSNENQPLRLLWFSQTVGKFRGIEDVILALGLLKGLNCQLTLLGHCSEVVRKYLLLLAEQNKLNHEQVKFLAPIVLKSLIDLANSFDIGLCLERNDSKNKDFCLSNKLFMYILAGNAIIATDTTAQTTFMQGYPEIGRVYQVGNTEELASHIKFFYENRDALNRCKQKAFDFGKLELNWEVEQKNFMKLVELQLCKHRK